MAARNAPGGWLGTPGFEPKPRGNGDDDMGKSSGAGGFPVGWWPHYNQGGKMDYQERYYYLRHKETNHPIVTVCLIQTNQYLARGVAICSPKDRFHKEVGRKKARGRAIKAIRALKTDYFGIIIRLEAMRQVWACDYPLFVSKSEFNPDLTDFERRILRMDREAA
jgi:hypothetical protein